MPVESGGEKPDDRRVIDSNTRDLVDAGVPADKARRLSRESMQRIDAKLRREGKR